MFPNISLSFITNIVKGTQSYKKRLKLMQYFKEKIGSTRVLFLQETNSSSKAEKNWKNDFNGNVFFSNRKTNSFGVLTAQFAKKKSFNVKKQDTDKEDRILIFDVSANDSVYVLINLYNANTEKEKINVFSNMFALLKKFDINKNKQIIMREILIYFWTRN